MIIPLIFIIIIALFINIAEDFFEKGDFFFLLINIFFIFEQTQKVYVVLL
jgi:hypothetical protein